jgi:hypothetical protein
MSTKITVNGIAYDSVEAMPSEVRRLYEETVAKLPAPADRDGDDVPEIVESFEFGPLKFTTTVRKQIIVNGTKYEGEATMPPEVRHMFEEAMRGAKTMEPAAKSDIKWSFKVTGGPGLNFGKALGAPSHQKGQLSGPISEPKTGTPPFAPIEPNAAEGRLRWTFIVLGACLAGGLLLWFLVGQR